MLSFSRRNPVYLCTKKRAMRINKLFIVDLLLLLLFIPTVASGFGMHIAGHGDNHTVWHNWGVAHTLISTLFAISVFAHIYLHWGWYKGLFRKPLAKRSRMSIVISLLFVTLTISAILSLSISEGQNSHIGIAHYKIGIVATLFFAWHIIKRLKILTKGLFGDKS